MASNEHEAFAQIELDSKSHVPVYYQLYEALHSQLGSAPFPSGSKLATEREIAEALGTSRQTVRQAFARLEREGLLFRRQGDGTYVSEPRVVSGLRFLRGFTSEISARGLRVRSTVLDLRLVTAPAIVGEKLGFTSKDERAVMLRRVRSLDGIPATLETVWLPASVCAQLVSMNMTDKSLYSVLREQFGIEPKTANETLTGTVLDEYEAGELDQAPGAAALLVERTTHDADGRCIEVVKSLLRADRFSFTAQLDLEHDAVINPVHHPSNN
ncbi:GntR family transcriptional regulator [Salinibacterium amurskyense]|uniref:GntR family transcriptional regulator n=1 Tax=Salinibacterium amurskyense TaxID=205941 RepID=UPI00311F8C25